MNVKQYSEFVESLFEDRSTNWEGEGKLGGYPAIDVASFPYFNTKDALFVNDDGLADIEFVGKYPKNLDACPSYGGRPLVGSSSSDEDKAKLRYTCGSPCATKACGGCCECTGDWCAWTNANFGIVKIDGSYDKGHNKWYSNNDGLKRWRPTTRRVMFERASGWILASGNYKASELMESCAYGENSMSFGGIAFRSETCPTYKLSMQCCGFPQNAWGGRDDNSYCGVLGDFSYPIDAGDVLPGDVLVSTKNAKDGGYGGQTMTVTESATKVYGSHVVLIRHVLKAGDPNDHTSEWTFKVWQMTSGGENKCGSNEVTYSDKLKTKVLIRRRNIVKDDLMCLGLDGVHRGPKSDLFCTAPHILRAAVRRLPA